MDSEMAEKTLSKSSRKRRCRDTGPPDVEPGGLTELPDAEPIKLGLHTVLPPVGSEMQATTEPAATTEAVPPPTTLVPSPWGKGDPPASIMGKWPRPLGKTKTGQRPWHQVCDVDAIEFKNALQVARATKGAERTLEQIGRASCRERVSPYV